MGEQFEESIRPIRDSFGRLGIEDVSRAKSLQGRRSLHEQRPGEFEPLSLVRAIAVRVRDEELARRVLAEAERDFTPVFDIRTESDGAWTAAEQNGTRLPRQRWPDWTGLTGQSAAQIDGAGVLIGVLDTGVDADHIEFKTKTVEFRYFPPNVVDALDEPRNVRGFDTDGHGTHVSSIIAGRKGIVPGAKLHVAAVIESQTLRASLWRTVYGLDWLFRFFSEKQNLNVPSVINLSLCFYEDVMDRDDVDGWRLLLGRAVEDLARKDVVVVAAAGNRGAGFTGFPANFENVIAVGAVDAEQRVAGFSGLPTPGARRDVYGLGVGVHAAYERDRQGRSYFRPMDGTSMAAPYVAGIAAMLRATKPGAPARAVRDHIIESAITTAERAQVARFVHWPKS